VQRRILLFLNNVCLILDNFYSCSSRETAAELLAYVKAPHSWLLSTPTTGLLFDEEYQRSHVDVSVFGFIKSIGILTLTQEPFERIECELCSAAA
jgi:hypothetical protein